MWTRWRLRLFILGFAVEQLDIPEYLVCHPIGYLDGQHRRSGVLLFRLRNAFLKTVFGLVFRFDGAHGEVNTLGIRGDVVLAPIAQIFRYPVVRQNFAVVKFSRLMSFWARSRESSPLT